MKKLIPYILILLFASFAYGMKEPPVQELINANTNLNAIETNQTDKSQLTQITDGTEEWTINSEGRGDVVEHAHVDSGQGHFDDDIAASVNYILVDISDTTNYPHANTIYAHLEWIRIEIDATAAANYEVEFAFIENVDATNSDIYVFSHVIGTRTAGQSKEFFNNFYPNGQEARSASLVTHDIRLNDTTFQTDVNQFTIRDPDTSDTPSGDGDVVMLVTITAGEIDLTVEFAYHSH